MITHNISSSNANLKRSILITYHIAHIVPCYAHKFAMMNTTYNVSQLMVYKYDMNERESRDIHPNALNNIRPQGIITKLATPT